MENLEKWFFVGNDWQGQVLNYLGEGFFSVSLFSWIGGYLTCRRVVYIQSMLDWDFYIDEEVWREKAQLDFNKKGQDPHA